MVKVYYIKNKDSTDINKLNDDIKANVKIICFIFWKDCGHCTSVTPLWEEVSDKFKIKHPELNNSIAYIDKDVLDLLNIDKQPTSFPYFATIKGDKIKEFNPDRTVSGLMKFLEEESENKTPKLKGGATKKRNKKTNKKTRKITFNKYLFKSTKPFITSKIKVNKIHNVAYYCYGNKNGKPVLVVHGGPGGATTPKMARYFDPKKYFIVLVDQRGCGNSTPLSETKNNNTHELISDFEKIRTKLKIKKWMLFGGSWGSFLSLVYAIKHPEIVTNIIVRGIFLGGKDEIEWVNGGSGANYFFPDKWDDYIKLIPENERHDLIKAYGRRFEGELGNKIKNKALYNWAKWEFQISQLHPMNDNEIDKQLRKRDYYKTFAILEYHYFKNNCFVPSNYLKNKNVYKKLKNIPIDIVHGRYDIICPPKNAKLLHDLIPHSKLYFTQSGHTMFELENTKKLIEITNYYKN